MQKTISKLILPNGLTVLVYPRSVVPKVSTQLWYGVGSKDETSGQRGLAHLIEHMIFKGTKRLSESDLDTITHKLSGYCNAFTSYDFTAYVFDFPASNWKVALDIMSDCMRNCTFKEEHLNSEFKAVVQELKMYRDDYDGSLVEAMLADIFSDHPYHHPVIGYKQDLLVANVENLKAFYQQHYVPNNAVLVVVGDVTPQEVFDEAEKYFGALKADPNYQHKTFYYNQDILARSVTLRRPVQQATVLFAFVLPGARRKKEYLLDIMQWVLCTGRGSRLYKKLVDDLQLTTSVEGMLYDLFDHGIFFLRMQPKDGVALDDLKHVVQQEIDAIIEHGLTEQELLRATKQVESSYRSLFESNAKIATYLGEVYLATGNEGDCTTYLSAAAGDVQKELQELLRDYFRPSVMHWGQVLPLEEEEEEFFVALQEQADEDEALILQGRVRTTDVEEPAYANSIVVQQPAPFAFPRHKKHMLTNGIEVLYFDNPGTGTISFILEFKADAVYDPQERAGLTNFMMAMMLEGTKNYTAQQFANEIESRGMALQCEPGFIVMNMLEADLEHGLKMLHELVTNALFPEDQIEKVREQLLADLSDYWDDPAEFVEQLTRQAVYKKHPYSVSLSGTKESLSAITCEDLRRHYKKFITPYGAHFSLAGDLQGRDIPAITQRILGVWQGPVVDDIIFPTLTATTAEEINYPINRDQVVLVFAALSVRRTDPDYDALVLFDQILTGGILGAMRSRLFELREQEGLFYTIGGSLVTQAQEEPGIICIKTIVSQENLADAERKIKHVLATGIDSLTEEELESARNALVYASSDNAECNSKLAHIFLFLERYNLDAQYLESRAASLKKITVDQVKATVKKWLKPDDLIVVRSGRLS